jgi:hypothetical protein
MSSGAFQSSKYETNSGAVLKCRIQPETLDFTIAGTANTATSAAIDTPGSARMGGGKRRFGVTARAVYINFDDGAPAGYKDGVTYAIPCLRTNVYDAAETAATGTYLGTTCRIVGRRSESVK